MAQRKVPYKRRETWEEVGMLVDLALLKLLLDGNAREGAKKKFIEVALPSSELHRRLSDPDISKTRVAGRMSSLRQLKLITPVRIFPTSAGRGWQITEKGEEVLKKHGHKLDETESS